MSGPYAKKSLGQHFLRDEKAIDGIVNSITEGAPLVLEIGPGRGALTTKLHRRCQRLVLLEKDDAFASHWVKFFDTDPNPVFVAHQDALEFDYPGLWNFAQVDEKTPLEVCSNLPYNVGTEILFRLLPLSHRIPKMVLMFQREVGERIAAKHGSKAYASISVAAQDRYEVTIQQTLKPGAFSPPPKVDSVVLEFKARPARIFTTEGLEGDKKLERMLRAAFSQRRKTILNSLRGGWSEKPWAELLAQSGIDGMRRAETLSLEEFRTLWDAVKAHGR